MTHLINSLIDAAREVGTNLPPESASRVQLYFRELLAWNQKINLTGSADETVLLLDHFIDSLLPSKFIPLRSTLVDIGSGAGFPGIPLKIIRPDISVTLLDASLKKIVFLRHIVRTLDLKGVSTYHGRTEDCSREKRIFSVCIGKAFGPLSVFLPAALPLRTPGGVIIAMKGPNYKREVQLVESNFSQWSIALRQIEHFVLPSTNKKRAILVFG
ncbi:MAG: 16S rRNA (guanine(527)-N(7))-methyltransferase RsmG [Deltaproteobacteria bacterium]|nr:16S rRNA (guanine(527)-N(7))-methyltransferase RsmG [Deltaproteobacteria bacterium]